MPRAKNPVRPSHAGIDPGHAGKRGALRALGAILTVLGGGLAAVGVVDFLGAFTGAGRSGPPTLFWCLFLGLPLLGLGVMLLKLGYLGVVGRYVAGETAPVAKDAFGYLAEGTKAGVREVARAVGEGLRGERGAPACAVCGATGSADARFCDECGSPLTEAGPACPGCRGDNDAGARYCRHCGQALPGA